MDAALKKTSDERLDFRVSREDKNLIEQAARLSGQTLTAFARSLLLRHSREVVSEYSSTQLSSQDRDIFLNALEHPASPNKSLKAAAQEYRKQLGHNAAQ